MKTFSTALSVRMKKGFTLIELLVVVAIIILLTGIVLASLNPAKSKARDSKRISDLGQLQLALELYFDRCKQYPQTSSGTQSNVGHLLTTSSNGCPSGITLGTFISQIPTPPSGGYYDYAINTITTPTDFGLHTTLEKYNEVLKDSISGTGSSWIVSWFDCYDPASTLTINYCISSK